MSIRLKAIFKNVTNLQEAANTIMANHADTDEKRLALLKDVIAGNVQPTFEISESILAWEAAQKRAKAPKMPKSQTSTGSSWPKVIEHSIKY